MLLCGLAASSMLRLMAYYKVHMIKAWKAAQFNQIWVIWVSYSFSSRIRPGLCSRGRKYHLVIYTGLLVPKRIPQRIKWLFWLWTMFPPLLVFPSAKHLRQTEKNSFTLLLRKSCVTMTLLLQINGQICLSVQISDVRHTVHKRGRLKLSARLL